MFTSEKPQETPETQIAISTKKKTQIDGFTYNKDTLQRQKSNY
jgi:hypothetical protein